MGLGAPCGNVGVEGLDRATSQWPMAHGGPGKRLPSQLVGGVTGVDLVLPVQHLGLGGGGALLGVGEGGVACGGGDS